MCPCFFKGSVDHDKCTKWSDISCLLRSLISFNAPPITTTSSSSLISTNRNSNNTIISSTSHSLLTVLDYVSLRDVLIGCIGSSIDVDLVVMEKTGVLGQLKRLPLFASIDGTSMVSGP